MDDERAPRRRRRAVGPPGAWSASDEDSSRGGTVSVGGNLPEDLRPHQFADEFDDDDSGDQRLRREVPPHHGD